jgi:hypothetical protein
MQQVLGALLRISEFVSGSRRLRAMKKARFRVYHVGGRPREVMPVVKWAVFTGMLFWSRSFPRPPGLFTLI